MGRRSTFRHLIALSLAALLGFALLAVAAPAAQAHSFSVLVFSKTAGFRHDSIPAGIQMIKDLGTANEFTVTATEDAGQFTDATLAQYDVVVWLSTTGDVLNADQQAAFERYIRAGGGYAGIHAASDTEYDWPWYGELVGAYFAAHPQNQSAEVHVPDRQHPSTKDLPKRWNRFDEWYNYRGNPRGKVHVLATLDESSYQPGGGAMGHDHPIAWCQNYDGGRAWYTGMGHTIESYADPAFRQHVLGGIKTASGHDPADCGATVKDNFGQVTLAKGAAVMGEPMGLAVLPGGAVLHTSRDGTVHYTPQAGQTSTAAKLDVYSFREDGMQGIAIDPDFANNKWVYLFYSPKLNTPPGEVPHNSNDPSVWDAYKGYNQISRFKFTDAGTLDLASEQKIIQVPQDRGNCCHHGGDLDFDAQGNLYLSTGDDADPFESNGYSPIDDRVTRAPQFDARRTSGNTNDLRGKLLRIKVAADGTYTIPAGNMFAPGTEKTKPEIYAMGFRNPFRVDVDDKTGVVWVGEYGPDAGAAGRYGPAGQVEFARVDAPGNYGWPFCTGSNTVAETYFERTFTSTYLPSDPNKGDNDPVGARFDCAAGAANNSRLNTGLAQVPPAKGSWLKYDGGSVPALGTGSESPMGGPVYHFDPANPSKTKFPAYYDNQFFGYEFGRRWVKNISIDDADKPLNIDPFSSGLTLTQLIDAEFGPDGSLYILDYGTGFFNGDHNSALYRVDYVAGSRAPIAVASADRTSGLAPLQVTFSSEGSRDPDPGDVITAYAWDFDGNGTTDSTEQNPTHTYTRNGAYTARLTVTDSTDRTGVSAVQILVGNTAPVLRFADPPGGYIYTPGETVSYRVEVTDPDGQPVDCAKVLVTYAIGHDSHTHGGQPQPGCTGSIATTDAGHGTDDNMFGLLLAEFTDVPPSPDAPPVKGTTQIVMQPDHRQAEHFAEMNGIQVVGQSAAEGGARVGYIDNGDWIAFEPYNLKNIKAVQVRGSSGAGGGTISFRLDSPTGPEVASVYVPSTGGWDNYIDLDPVPLTDPGGTHKLYLTFTGGFDIDAFTFQRSLPQPCTGPRPPANDEFDGSTLDRCRWSVIRHTPARLRVAGGNLEIDAIAGDLFGGTNDAKNLVVQPVPATGGFEAITKLDIGGSADFEQGGMVVTGTGNNFVKAVLLNIPGQGWRMEFGQNINGTAVFDEALDRSGPLPASTTDAVWIKVRSDGHTLTGHWSADGTTWTQFGRPRALNTLPDPKVGLAAYHGTGGTAKFDFFHLVPIPATPCAGTAPEAGYRSLFDGTAASLAGWKMAGPGGFAYAGCELMSHGGLGMYWYQAQSFRDYSLKLDWKVAGDDNSGVFVGFPDVGTDPWVAVDKGREVQIDATDDPDSTTGAIYNAQAPDAAARDAALKPPGQWNQYEIVVQGKRLRVYLNGALINDWTETDPNRLNQPSFIGLQNHGNGDEVFFRNVRARELTPPVITVAGVAETTYGDSQQITPVFTATDTESGVATLTGQLDGKPIASGSRIDLYKLPLGAHTLTITATDKALNQATKTVRFSTTTSYADVRALVTAFRAAGRISLGQAAALRATLDQAEKAQQAGKLKQARAALLVFRAIAGSVRDTEVRTVLRRDADVLIQRTNQ